MRSGIPLGTSPLFQVGEPDGAYKSCDGVHKRLGTPQYDGEPPQATTPRKPTGTAPPQRTVSQDRTRSLNQQRHKSPNSFLFSV